MKLFKILLNVTLIIAAGYTLKAQQPDKINLTLQEAITIGLKNNYNILISNKQVEIDKNNNSWGNAGRYPTITFNVTNANRLDNSENPATADRIDTRTHTLAPGLNLRWTLFRGFGVNITKDNFEKLQQISNGNAAVAVENTIQDIVTAYFSLQIEKEKMAVVEKVMKLSKDRYTQMQMKKELGSAVTFDLLQEKNAFLSDSSNFILQSINYRNAERYLSLVMADTSAVIFSPTDELLIQNNQYALADLIDKMLENNKTLKNQYIYQQLKENSVKMAKTQRYPTLSLNLGTDYSNAWVKYGDADLADSYTYDFYGNLTLSYTLFNGGNRTRAIENARIEQDIFDIQLQQIKHQLTNQLMVQYEMYNARKQLYNVAQENLKSAELNMQIAEERFKSGSINSFNYRDIQLMYINTAFSKLQAVFDLIQAHSELMRLTGGVIAEY